MGEPDSDTAPALGRVPWTVVEVRVLGAHRLFVRFIDRTAGEVDAGPMILGPRAGVFERLRDPDEFTRAYVEDGVVTRPGELDLAPDAMYDAIRSSGRWVISRH